MKKFDLTDIDLANKVNVNRTTVTRWRTGIRSPKLEKLPEIASVFNADPRIFISNEDEKETTENMSDKLMQVFNQLESPRQKRVYNFANNQLAEQNNVVRLEDAAPRYLYQTAAQDVQILGVVSAGTGEFLDGEAHKEVITYHGNIPEHDYALRVNGDSMEPMFEDNQIIFVRNFDGDLHNGQIIIAVVDDEAFIKKLDIHEDAEYLVSLNPAYQPIKINEYNDFSIKGIVVL
jgi:phage repressor protein C with HTH and peptisase S24 domain